MSDLLKNTTRPPEVRIACRKDLPRKLVYDMRNDLEEFRKMGMINNTVATVVDAGEK